MTSPLVDSLVYSSRANPTLTDTELELILIKARVFNASREVTGVLLKTQDRILQYLEGAPDVLERTFLQIQRSPFHSDVQLLARAKALPRHFTKWHMGFHEIQRRSDRDDATRLWLEALPSVERAAKSNACIAALLDAWQSLGGSAAPTAVIDID